VSATSSPPSSKRDKYLQKNYHITEAEYRILFDWEGGCWACGALPKEGKNLHVDHNHKTKNVRAILCWACNQIGRARGPAITPERLRGLAEVLEHGEEWVESLIGHNGKGK
jgi:hypothetical protein